MQACKIQMIASGIILQTCIARPDSPQSALQACIVSPDSPQSALQPYIFRPDSSQTANPICNLHPEI